MTQVRTHEVWNTKWALLHHLFWLITLIHNDFDSTTPVLLLVVLYVERLSHVNSVK